MNIPTRTKREVVDWLLQRTDVFAGYRQSVELLDRVWDLRHTEATVGGMDSLYHELLREDELEREDLLYEKIDVVAAAAHTFISFVEACVHPLVIPAEGDRSRVADELNGILAPADLVLRPSSKLSGNTVYAIEELQPPGRLDAEAEEQMGGGTPAPESHPGVEHLPGTEELLLAAAYANARTGSKLNMRTFAEEHSLDYHEDVLEAFYALQDRGWVETASAGSLRMTGLGVLGCEERGLADEQLHSIDARVRAEILSVAGQLVRDRGCRAIVRWEEVADLIEADHDTIEFNGAVLADLGYISRRGMPASIELSEAAWASVKDLQERQQIQSEISAAEQYRPGDRSEVALDIFNRLAAAEAWELIREEDSTRVYRHNQAYYAVRCAWTDEPVGVEDIRPLRAVLRDRPAWQGVFVSMSTFTDGARELLRDIAGRQPIAGLTRRDIDMVVSGTTSLSDRLAALIDEKVRSAPLGRGISHMVAALGFPFDVAEIDPKRNEVFIAHPYTEFDCEDFRRSLGGVLDDCHLEPKYADEDITSTHILGKICRMIQECRFGIYDLSNWNPNVALELGLAIGLQRPSLLLLDTRKSDEVPADLRGLDRIQYGGMAELERELRKKLPGFAEECSR